VEVTNYRLGDALFRRNDVREPMSTRKLNIPIAIDPDISHPPPAPIEVDDGSHRPSNVDLAHPFPSGLQPSQSHRDVHHVGDDGYDTHEDDDDAAGPKLTPICVNPETVTPVVPVVEKDDGAHRPSNVADPAHPFSSGESAAPVPHRDIHHAGDAGYETHDSEDDC